MIETKLILVEGSIGAGKTTTAENLAKKIKASGDKAVWYHENAPDNPLNTYLSKLLQDNYGRHFDLQSVIMKLLHNDPSIDTIPLWRALSERCKHRDEITILESRFWQHETMIWFLAEFDLASIIKRQQEIAEILSECKPFLVFLSHDNISSVIENTFRTRPLEWQEWVLWLFGEFPYFQSHHLTGMDGFIKFYEAWDRVGEELFRIYPYSKVELRNPHADWSTAIKKLNEALDIV